MSKYAVVSNFEVIQVIETEIFPEELSQNLLVDITDLIIPPGVGWKLEGNKLVPPAGVNLQLIVESKIKKFQQLSQQMIIEIYTTNTLLGITTQQSDQMFDDYIDILLRLKEGAWPTALYRLNTKQPNGFVTQEMLNSWKAVITNYLQTYG